MILPQTYLQTLMLLILGVVCWAVWANLLPLAKCRYELYYLDVALGVAFAAGLYAFTLGNIGFDGLAVTDDLTNAGRRQLLFGFGGGAFLNLGMLLVFAASSAGGISVAFPIGIGLGLAVGAFLPRVLSGTGNRGMLLAAMACSLVAITLAVLSHASRLAEKYAAIPRDAKKKHSSRPSPLKVVLLSVAGGLLMALAFPLFEKSRVAEVGIGPYALGLLIALGTLGTTAVASIFLINLPVEGEPVEPFDYFTGKFKTHLVGWISGILLATGTLAPYVVDAATRDSHLAIGKGITYYQAAPVLAGFIAVLVWKEFAGSRAKGKIVLALLVAGVAAALYAAGS
jgi:glucose uptake protein